MKQPFTTKNTTSIAYDWSLVGSTTPTKSFVRLTSALTDSFGGLCQAKPTVFRDWTAEFEIRARDGNGGDGFWFYFSSDFCVAGKYNLVDTTKETIGSEGETIVTTKTDQMFPDRWDGFVLWINTSSNVGRSPIYMAQSYRKKEIDYRRLVPLGTFQVRGDTPVKIKITRKGDYVQARFQRDYTVYNFEQTFSDLPEQGYFSLSATTTILADNNDVLSFKVTPMSEVKKEYVQSVPENITKINRNMLLLKKETRRIKKRSRASSMQKALEYDSERKQKDHKIDGRDFSFNDMPQLVEEATERARSTITNEMLSDFLVPDIERTLTRATMRINLQMERFKETRTDLDEVWSGLRNTLRELSLEARENMTKLGREALSFANQVTLKGADEIESNKNINNVVRDESMNGSSFIPFICFCTCMVEFVLYVIWFNAKRIRTMNFKKAD
jgi:hypothetical protein